MTVAASIVGALLGEAACTRFGTPQQDAGSGGSAPQTNGAGGAGSSNGGASGRDAIDEMPALADAGDAADTSCGNTASDRDNCGACSHACLGGDCTDGVCQPFVLGAPSTDYAQDLLISGGKVYVFAQTTSRDRTVWQVDANLPGLPSQVTGTPANPNILGCIADGQLFWVAGAPSESIYSCALSNCAGSTQPIVPNLGDPVTLGPVCDTKTDELVWITRSSNISTIYRASPNGSGSRPVTSVTFEVDGADWAFANETGHFSNSRADRAFFVRNDANSNTGTLFYISTILPNTSRVSVATVSGTIMISGASVLANDGTVIASFAPTSLTSNSFSAPLPNGVLSGAPPQFLNARIPQGVTDQAF
jgi:hypothetical protein